MSPRGLSLCSWHSLTLAFTWCQHTHILIATFIILLDAWTFASAISMYELSCFNEMLQLFSDHVSGNYTGKTANAAADGTMERHGRHLFSKLHPSAPIAA